MATRSLAYRASSTVTNAIESLATSSTWVAGYESATIDNTSNLDLDILLSGITTVGTTPTANTVIEHWVVPIIDSDGSTWPDVFDGTTSAETVTSREILLSCGKLAASIDVPSTTSNISYPWGAVSVRALFGSVPPKFVVFTTHNTGVNLNATAGNQKLFAKGVYETVA